MSELSEFSNAEKVSTLCRSGSTGNSSKRDLDDLGQVQEAPEADFFLDWDAPVKRKQRSCCVDKKKFGSQQRTKIGENKDDLADLEQAPDVPDTDDLDDLEQDFERMETVRSEIPDSACSDVPDLVPWQRLSSSSVEPAGPFARQRTAPAQPFFRQRTFDTADINIMDAPAPRWERARSVGNDQVLGRGSWRRPSIGKEKLVLLGPEHRFGFCSSDCAVCKAPAAGTDADCEPAA